MVGISDDLLQKRFVLGDDCLLDDSAVGLCIAVEVDLLRKDRGACGLFGR